MKAQNLDDVVVHRKAAAASSEVFALLQRPAFRNDYDLCDQLSRSTRRIAPLIAEGYGQVTDRQMADYLGRARGSAYESISHLADAATRKYISKAEHADMCAKYTDIVKMLTAWINYLHRSNWRIRGNRPAPDGPSPE